MCHVPPGTAAVNVLRIFNINLSKHKQQNCIANIKYLFCHFFFKKKRPVKTHKTNPGGIQTALKIKWDMFARI